EWGVGGERPAPRVVRIGARPTPVLEMLEAQRQGLRRAVEKQVLVEGAVGAALGAGAVVGDRNDQGVVQLAQLIQEGYQLADVMIDVGKVGRVHFHLVGV